MRHILTLEQVEELRKEVKDKSDYIEVNKLKLYYRYWLPEKADKILLCLHGLGGHSGGYKLLAQELNKENTAVYALDQRGHGLSDGTRGDIEDFYSFIKDADRMVEMLKEKHKPRKTLYRDLQAIVDKAIFKAHGKRKGRKYSF